jgi:hypothetical protein
LSPEKQWPPSFETRFALLRMRTINISPTA